MFELIIQLHGGHSGGGGGGETIKQSAPTSNAAGSISAATNEQRQQYQELLRSAKGKNFTNKTKGMAMENSIKKALLGE